MNIEIERELMLALYWGNCYSLNEIKKILDCSQRTVVNIMNRYNIPRRTISEARIKSKGWNKGLHWSNEIKEKISKSNMKSDEDIGYHAFHYRLRKNKPKPNICEICNKNKPIEIANKSGEYYKDFNDYMWLCHSCHMRLDKPYEEWSRDKFGKFIGGNK